MEESDIRFKISASRRMLYREGCDSNVGGHVSVRDADNPDHFYITPMEYFDETLPDRVLKMTMDLKVLEGDWEASMAASFHAAVYKMRPDANSVIHTHSFYTSLAATRSERIGMYNVVSVLFHEEQGLYEDDGTKPPVYGPELGKALGKGSVVLMKNHGALIVDASLERCTARAIALEMSARYHMDAKAYGGTEFAVAETVRGKKSYEKFWMPMMWESNFRRLRKSDADLWEWLESHNQGKKVASVRPAARVGGALLAKN